MTTCDKHGISLRALEPEDLDLLYSVENDPGLSSFGNSSVPYSRKVLGDYIMSTTGDIYTDKQLRLIVSLATGGRPGKETIGIVDLIDFDPLNSRAEVGIVILEPYRRRGYATRALDLLAGYAKTKLRIHQLYAFVRVDNAASRALFRRCGYEDGMELEDWLFDGESYRNAVLAQKIL